MDLVYVANAKMATEVNLSTTTTISPELCLPHIEDGLMRSCKSSIVAFTR